MSPMPTPETYKLMEKLICQLAQYYLGIIGTYTQTSEKEFHLKFTENPISLYVELPESLEGLCYSNIICGIMRGMLEISGFEIKCEFAKDKMKGDDINDLKITLVKLIEERFIDENRYAAAFVRSGIRPPLSRWASVAIKLTSSFFKSPLTKAGIF